MNCDEFRLVVGAEPHSTREDVILHASQCMHCAAYRREIQDMDRAILRALQVDVVEATRPADRARPRQRTWQIAAGVVLALLAALTTWVAIPTQSFAQQVVEHVHGEPESLVRTSRIVSEAELQRVLSRSGVRLKPGVARISYAMSCWFRGHYVPHIVVQTAEGPVTVLIMSREHKATRTQAIREDGFEGVVVPAPRGVLVVLGQHASVESVTTTVLGALDYES